MQLSDLVERFLETYTDLKDIAKRKKDLTAESNDLKEQIMELMRAEGKNKIEFRDFELILKTSKRTKSPTVSDVIVLMEGQLKAVAIENAVQLHPEFVENFMDDFIASVESQKNVTETDTLQVKHS